MNDISLLGHRTARPKTRPVPRPRSSRLAFGGVVLLVSILFLWSILAFVGAILWSLVAALMFASLNDWMLVRFPNRPTLAASLTLLVVIGMAVLPTVLLALFLLDQAGAVYGAVQSGQIDIAATFERLQGGLPIWISTLLRRIGVTDLNSLGEQLSVGLTARLQSLTSYAITIGQGAASFLLSLAVMLYVTFFLLRDGRSLAAAIGAAVPLAVEDRQMLAERFVAIVRATVKGGVLVGAAQGTAGGAIMVLLGVPNALLLAVLMAIASLLPAVGTGIVWLPVSLYLFAAEQPGRGISMLLAGLLVIGTIDNILRPILIGRETRIPDFVILVTTLGGISAFGFNGLLIGPVAAGLFITVWSRFALRPSTCLAIMARSGSCARPPLSANG